MASSVVIGNWHTWGQHLLPLYIFHVFPNHMMALWASPNQVSFCWHSHNSWYRQDIIKTLVPRCWWARSPSSNFYICWSMTAMFLSLDHLAHALMHHNYFIHISIYNAHLMMNIHGSYLEVEPRPKQQLINIVKQTHHPQAAMWRATLFREL